MSEQASEPVVEPKEEATPEEKPEEEKATAASEEIKTEEAPSPVAQVETKESDEKKDRPATAEEEHDDGPKILPTFRCVIMGEGSAGHRANLLLQDMMRLHRIIWKLQGKEPPTSPAEAMDIAENLFNLIKNGKEFELAGLKDVPKPFMKSKGRFLERKGKNWTEITDEKAKEALAGAMVEEFKVDDLGDMSQTPFNDFKAILEREPKEDEPLLPQPKDAVLFLCEDSAAGEKMYEQQSGNKSIFSLASQLVSSATKTSEKRVEAALLLLKGLDEAELHDEDKEKVSPAVASQNSRFMVRLMESDAKINWKLLSGAEAAQFAVVFIFEVFLEKEIHLITYNAMGNALDDISAGIATLPLVDAKKPGTEPIDEPTDYDVLFGRGGMTNSHPGNRRFRDIIALHRPDYIRAIKMDKPGVARKIVRAIRAGTPPGRFLKKNDDGRWYDVGDRTAAEKTSQGLRERSNAEKRDRQALRESLRGNKDGEEEDGEEEGSESKKQKTSDSVAVGTLDYGANIGVPLTLSMKQTTKKKSEGGELVTAGLPPNAVDEEGNILVTDYDILCGRGGLTNHHKGNKRFRDIVALHRPDYVRAPKIQKPSVARVIVRAIRNGDPPGRFLRKDEKSGKWVDVGDKKAAEKTSQALREKTNEERDKTKRDPATLGVNVLLPDPSSYLAAVTGAPLVLPSTVVVKTKTEEPTEEGKKDENETPENGEKSAGEIVDERNDASGVKEGVKEDEEETPQIATV